MFKKIFTNRQLSLFFQIAIFFNIVSMLSDVILYRYFPKCTIIKYTNTNLSNLSIFIICAILISQVIRNFLEKYPNFIKKYKFLGIATIIIISTFLWLILNLDNTIQGKSIIFFSNLSRIQHNNKTLYIVIGIVIMLIFNFYRNFKDPQKINNKTILSVIYDAFSLLIKEYAVIFLTLFTIFNINQLTYFQSHILNYSLSSLFSNLHFLKIAVPVGWIIIILYYLIHRTLKNKYQK